MESINSIEEFVEQSPGHLFVIANQFNKKEINSEYKLLGYLTDNVPFLVISAILFPGKWSCGEAKIIQNNILGYIVLIPGDFNHYIHNVINDLPSPIIKKWKL